MASASSKQDGRRTRTPVIALTMGDPGGIGPEIIVKSLQKKSLRTSFRYVLFGSSAPFRRLESPSLKKTIQNGKLIFVDVTNAALQNHRMAAGFDSGKVTQRNALLAMEALRQATLAAVQGSVDAIVTAPVHKTAMRLVDPKFHGHTEYLAHHAGVRKFAMMFASPRLIVTLVTIHEPIRKVASLLSANLILEKICLTQDALKNRFGIRRPRLAVCCLNPHGRETGSEDERVIRPAVRKAQAIGIQAVGPLSADQVFYEAYTGNYDAVISMYHDQGLAPFKMIAFRDGVNMTLGLPFIRTSPDHGTAHDIAYQGKADPSSFLSAWNLAEQLTAHGA